jgi:hypothetical protein
MAQKTDSLQQVDLTQLKNVLPLFYDNRQPLYLWGRPSTGKTSAIRQFAQAQAEKLKLRYSEDEFGEGIFTLKVITLSQFDSPDLRGMPQVIIDANDKTKSYTEFVPTAELPRYGQGILFFDEMNQADDTTRSACYQIILEGRYGSLPPVIDQNGKHTFWRVAASNTENDFCSVNTSSLALLRRFCHLSVSPTVKEVTDYFTKIGIDFRIPAYLSSFSDDLFPQKYDEKLIDNKANPFPSTWHSLGLMIQGLKTTNQKDDSGADTIYTLAASCVGAPTAAKFVSFVKMMGKIDIDKILKDPEGEFKEINKLPERASMMYAIVYSIGNMWVKKEHGLKAAETLAVASAMSPEFSVTFMTMILTNRRRMIELTAEKGFHTLLTRLGIFFDVI